MAVAWVVEAAVAAMAAEVALAELQSVIQAGRSAVATVDYNSHKSACSDAKISTRRIAL